MRVSETETPPAVGEDDGEGLTSRLAALAALLAPRGLTLSVAESCTGGLLGHVLTSRPGSSAFFLGGVIAYSNAVKHRLLGVAEETLQRHGAVSESVAAEMAAGVRLRMGADIGLSVTGVAGPDGGTEAKPVGLVYTALARADELVVRRNLFEGSRECIKFLSACSALDMLLDALTQ